MGFLDKLLQQAAPVLGKEMGSHPELVSGLTKVLTDGKTGGLAGLTGKFEQNGLGNIISSWISTGKNLPISPAQIQNVLGSNTVQNLAAKAGISPAKAASQLSTLLPALVDKITPNGKIPVESILQKGLGFLFKK
jgi:uncharacterized protein YidB (DUF937 family)